MPIISKSGEFTEYIYHIDLNQYGMSRVASSFLYWDGDTCLLMDCGTSDDVRRVLRMVKKFGIPYEKVRGIILTHYHFDHGGGTTKLWKILSKKNPKFKIMVPQDTHNKLQDASEHLKGAKTTFGEYIGFMNPAPEDAYEIITKDEVLPLELNGKYQIKLLSTNGHSIDHCSPAVFKDGKTNFIFTGEAAGTLFHGSKLVSLPTSMPPNFVYSDYMKGLQKIIELEPESIGLCHFGAIKGKNDVQKFLFEHKKYIEDFRASIIKNFRENSSTRYVIENMDKSLWKERVDPLFLSSEISKGFFNNLKLALVYGMMIDLGFRESKYETRTV